MSESEQICGCDKPDCYFCWLRNRINTMPDYVDIIPMNINSEIILHDILEKVSYASGVSIDDIKGRKRNSDICVARQIYCYIARKKTKASLRDIGDIIYRDHACVINSCRRANALIDINDKKMILVLEKVKHT